MRSAFPRISSFKLKADTAAVTDVATCAGVVADITMVGHAEAMAVGAKKSTRGRLSWRPLRLHRHPATLNWLESPSKVFARLRIDIGNDLQSVGFQGHSNSSGRIHFKSLRTDQNRRAILRSDMSKKKPQPVEFDFPDEDAALAVAQLLAQKIRGTIVVMDEDGVTLAEVEGTRKLDS